MRGHPHTADEQRDAVALVAEIGLAAAWRQTGIPKPTLVRWCQDAGVERFHPQKTRAAVAALEAQHAVLREQVRLELLEHAVDLLERMDEPHVEFKGKDADQVTYPIAPAGAVQNYATSVGILIDKYRLEMGEATGRTESFTNDYADHEARAIAESIRAELARRDGLRVEANAEATAVAGSETPEPDPATG